MIEQTKAMKAMAGAISSQCDALLSEFESVMCPHENCGLAAGCTMGEGNQVYICQDCGQEVTEDEYICSKER